MKLFVQLFLLVVLLGKCNYELDSIHPPNNLIPQDTFTEVLKDVMLLESQVKAKNSNVHTFYKSMPSSVNVIFEKYELDSTRFNSSMRYYSSKQNLMSEIYTAIQAEVEKEAAHLQEKDEEYEVVGSSEASSN